MCYRIFCANLAGKAHHVIDQYDKRADVENLVGEAKREGLDVIPSANCVQNSGSNIRTPDIHVIEQET